MKKLYCGSCGNYLMGADGDCHDCSCGWKQPEVEPEYPMIIDQLEDTIARLQAQVNALSVDAERYRWIRSNVSEEVYQRSSEFVGVKTKYVLPLMTAYAEFCGQITFDEAVDFMIGVTEQKTKGKHEATSNAST